MTSISLILSVAAFFSLAVEVVAQDNVNYSLWPRRPAELEQARGLMKEQKFDEAVALLQPFVGEKGIAGREARQITGAINVRRYLTRQHPRAAVHKVKRGENLARISSESQCPTEIIMLLNGLIEPSDLKAGQEIVLIPMDLRMELRPLQREITVWDGASLVAAYNIVSVHNVETKANEETTVKERTGTLNDVRLPERSTLFLSSERGIVLANGVSLQSGNRGTGAYMKLQSRDLNELALLLGVGGRVSIVCDDASFSPQSTLE